MTFEGLSDFWKTVLSAAAGAVGSIIGAGIAFALVAATALPSLAVECPPSQAKGSIGVGALANNIHFAGNMGAQPFGGELQFVVPSNFLARPSSSAGNSGAPGEQLAVCFRWAPLPDFAAKRAASIQSLQAEIERLKNQPSLNTDRALSQQIDEKNKELQQLKSLDDATWTQAVPVRVVSTDAGSGTTTLGVRIPIGLPGIERSESPPARLYQYEWRLFDNVAVVPTAEMRAVVLDANGTPTGTMDQTLTFGVTDRIWAGVTATAVSVLFWFAMYQIGRSRDVRGGFLLRVIANHQGYASLSQFQIMVWTVVIGASAIYVMMLSDQLIDIPTATLSLLGIAGITTVAAKLQKDDPVSSTSAAAASGAPNAVVQPRCLGQPGDTRVVLLWYPPADGVKPSGYTIRYRQAGGNWSAPVNLTEVPATVGGLTAATEYDFEVVATSAGGSGPASVVQGIRTTGPAGAVAVPGQPTVDQAIALNSSEARVTWNQPINAQAYVVLMRPAGTSSWTVASHTDAPTTAAKISGLNSNTDYEFCVCAAANGRLSELSPPKTIHTLRRDPKWGDLVVWNGTREIDVTRLQMLLFTLIASLFVLLKVATDSVIPVIPDGILLLMGISNGVYLAPKFLPPTSR
jgi:hypothetical protein